MEKSPACKIIDLAKAIHIFLKKKENINIIGSRHGEKLNETLVSFEKMVLTKETKNHFIIKNDGRSLDYNLYEDLGNKKRIKSIDYNSDSTNQLNIKEIISLLKSIKLDLN